MKSKRKEEHKGPKSKSASKSASKQQGLPNLKDDTNNAPLASVEQKLDHGPKVTGKSGRRGS